MQSAPAPARTTTASMDPPPKHRNHLAFDNVSPADGGALLASARALRRAELGNVVFECLERVGSRRARFAAVAGDADVLFVRFEPLERPRTDETVTANPLAANDALEQERPFFVRADGPKRRDRRQRIAEQLPVNRHNGVRGSQFRELVKTRSVTHEQLGTMDGNERVYCREPDKNGE